jgi:predicted secreted protein
MFSDARSKKIAFVSHCILNQNAISEASAQFPSQYQQVVDLLTENNIGIIQLRCPEFLCLGLNRSDDLGGEREVLLENSRIRMCLEEKKNRDTLRKYATEIQNEIDEYLKYGFNVLGIIGVNRSPSCGIETTTKNTKEIPGYGVFMHELKIMLENANLKIPMIGTKTSQVEASVKAVKTIIAKK